MTPEGVLFEGDTVAVQSKNASGGFSILPMHANFITIIQERVEIYSKEGSKVFRIKEGVLHTKENTVNIFTEIANNSPGHS